MRIWTGGCLQICSGAVNSLTRRGIAWRGVEGVDWSAFDRPLGWAAFERLLQRVLLLPAAMQSNAITSWTTFDSTFPSPEGWVDVWMRVGGAVGRAAIDHPLKGWTFHPSWGGGCNPSGSSLTGSPAIMYCRLIAMRPFTTNRHHAVHYAQPTTSSRVVRRCFGDESTLENRDWMDSL